MSSRTFDWIRIPYNKERLGEKVNGDRSGLPICADIFAQVPHGRIPGGNMPRHSHLA